MKNKPQKSITCNHPCSYLLLVPWILLYFLPSCSVDKSEEYTVMHGPFKQSVIETGELQAVRASFITAPRLSYQYGYQFKITGLAEHGKIVRKGDSVVAMDPSSIYKLIITREEALENDRATFNKQRVQMENNIQDLQAQLKKELAAYDLKKLELDRIQFESESKKRVKQLEFQQAGIKLEKVKRNLDLKPRLEDLDLRIQKIKVKQGESTITEARGALEKLVIRSPIDGVFQVYTNPWNGQNVRLGDNAYMGNRIASIPDVSRMKAMSFVNETDIRKVHKGMKAIVRLDALPSVPFQGVLTGISRICTAREDEKVFKTEVEIMESDIRLKPGMTVSCEYICFESDSGIYVPNSCLLKREGRSYIFLENGGSPDRVEVSAGPSNTNHTLVYGDLRIGQRLVPVEQIR